jgi:hypothetical protein
MNTIIHCSQLIRVWRWSFVSKGPDLNQLVMHPGQTKAGSPQTSYATDSITHGYVFFPTDHSPSLNHRPFFSSLPLVLSHSLSFHHFRLYSQLNNNFFSLQIYIYIHIHTNAELSNGLLVVEAKPNHIPFAVPMQPKMRSDTPLWPGD